MAIIIMKCCIIITMATTLTGMVRKRSTHRGQAPCSALHALWRTSCGRRSRTRALCCKRMGPRYLFRCVERGQGPAAQRVRACSRGEQCTWPRHRTPQCTFHSPTHMPPMQLSQQMSYREIHATRLPYKSSKMHSAGPLCIIHAENMETSYPDTLCFL